VVGGIFAMALTMKSDEEYEMEQHDAALKDATIMTLRE
jgi:hypothetical protein